MFSDFSLLLHLLAARAAFAYNFPYESIQLTDLDVGTNPDLAFGSAVTGDLPSCKNYPGYDGWPSLTQWSALNISLGGTLLKGIPPAAACYQGEYKDATICANVRRRQTDALFAYLCPDPTQYFLLSFHLARKIRWYPLGNGNLITRVPYL
jgi:hypothetical protein